MSIPKRAIEYLEKRKVEITSDIRVALEIAYEEGKGTREPIINFEEYDQFKKKMKDRFNQNGIIKTGEAWELAKGVASYSMLCNMMRYHMEEMERKDQATKLRKGVWIIQLK